MTSDTKGVCQALRNAAVRCFCAAHNLLENIGVCSWSCGPSKISIFSELHVELIVITLGPIFNPVGLQWPRSTESKSKERRFRDIFVRCVWTTGRVRRGFQYFRFSRMPTALTCVRGSGSRAGDGGAYCRARSTRFERDNYISSLVPSGMSGAIKYSSLNCIYIKD
jgi:hypothetical protein